MDIERLDKNIASRTIQQRSNDAGGSHIVDNRQSGRRNYLSDTSLQRLEGEEEEDVLQGKMEDAPRRNETGLPDNLKAGVESLSGYSLDDVRVHYNSSKPATVQALAYTQGTDIHVAPGQEKHLPHEAWHVAQQMAGRVSPTTNINGMPVNDNVALEHEADVMGAKAVQCLQIPGTVYNEQKGAKETIQRVPDLTLWDRDWKTAKKDIGSDWTWNVNSGNAFTEQKDARTLISGSGVRITIDGLKHKSHGVTFGISRAQLKKRKEVTTAFFIDGETPRLYALGKHQGGTSYELLWVNGDFSDVGLEEDEVYTLG